MGEYPLVLHDQPAWQEKYLKGKIRKCVCMYWYICFIYLLMYLFMYLFIYLFIYIYIYSWNPNDPIVFWLQKALFVSDLHVEIEDTRLPGIYCI